MFGDIGLKYVSMHITYNIGIEGVRIPAWDTETKQCLFVRFRSLWWAGPVHVYFWGLRKVYESKWIESCFSYQRVCVVLCRRLTIRTHDWFLGWETQRKSQRESVSRKESFKEKPERAIGLKVYKTSSPSNIDLGPLWQVRVLSPMWHRAPGPLGLLCEGREAQREVDGTSDAWWETVIPAKGWRRSDGSQWD